MSLPSLILRQNLSTQETRAMSHACMLMDIALRVVDITALESFEAQLRQGAMPVGSVEFVREAMRVAGMTEPGSMSYPESLHGHLEREVRQIKASNIFELQGSHFLKPVRTKLFTGFVFDAQRSREEYDDHDREQLDAVMALARHNAPHTLWISPNVSFYGEWRFYVQDGLVLASERYDDDESDALAPDALWVQEADRLSMADTPIAAFALEVGRLADGRCAVVEVNDGWSLGPGDYLQFLWARWQQMVSSLHLIPPGSPFVNHS